MDGFSFFAAGILVYVGISVLVLGLIYQIYKWFRVPRSSVPLGIFPRPQSSARRGLKLLKDSFLFPQVLSTDKLMWLFVILFHLTLLGIFFGHLRLIGEITPLVNVIGEENMSELAFWAGGTMGIAMFVSLFYFLVRRFKSPYKELSTPADYLLILLFLVVVFLGIHMRFFGNIELQDFQAYAHSMLAFRPSFPEAIAQSEEKWVLVGHMMTFSILCIYFPFSKLVHFIGGFATNLLRSDSSG